MTTNVQSIRNKIPEIQNFVDDNNIDCLLLTETWVTSEHNLAEIKLRGFQQPICYMRKHGGVCVYVKENISFTEIKTKTTCEDVIWIQFVNDSIPTIVGCIYRSPNSPDVNNRKMIEMLYEVHQSYGSHNIVITGDLNLPCVDWVAGTSRSNIEKPFIDCFDDMFLEQLVTETTRHRESQTPSLLDVILTNYPESISKITHFAGLGKSDHEVILFDLEIPIKVTNEPPKLDYFRVEDDKFTYFMETTNWYNIFNPLENFNTVGENFICRIGNIIHETVPFRRTSTNKPWFNRKLRKLYRKKERSWKNLKKHGTSLHWDRFRAARNAFNAMKEDAIIKYEKDIIHGKKSNKKRYYRYLSSKNPYPKNEFVLKNQNTLETEPFACANVLKTVFTNAFTDPNETTEVPYLHSRNEKEVTDVTIDPADIQIRLSKLKTPKSPGPDQISNVLLKRFAAQFALPLSLLFNRIIETGTIPVCFKEATVIPVYKKGSKQDPNNYRPVSLTSCILKVFEQILLDTMLDFVEENNIMSPYQHGFYRSRSTCTNLLNFWHDVTKLADIHSQISVIYTDMSKAFDRIPHKYLIAKLDNYGFRGKLLNVLRSYLEHRTQRVAVRTILSDPMDVTSGTPQGGVLSGLLFALYINDLPDVINNARIYIYADDVKLMMPVNNAQDINELQSEINAQSDWCDTWGLPLNPAKCQVLHYVPMNCRSPLQPKYMIKGEDLQLVDHIKDLGVTISKNLKFNRHIDETVKKTNSEIGRARRSFKCRHPNFLADLYKTYIRPNMEYCAPLWNPIQTTLIDKLEKTQNRFTRLLPNARNLSHDQRNQMLGITSHEVRRRRGDMLVTWEILEDDAHICRHLLERDPDTSRRSHSKKLTKKRFNNNISKQSFTNRIINSWNSLNEDVVSSTSKNMLKNRFDTSV